MFITHISYNDIHANRLFVPSPDMTCAGSGQSMWVALVFFLDGPMDVPSFCCAVWNLQWFNFVMHLIGWPLYVGRPTHWDRSINIFVPKSIIFLEYLRLNYKWQKYVYYFESCNNILHFHKYFKTIIRIERCIGTVLGHHQTHSMSKLSSKILKKLLPKVSFKTYMKG